MTDRRKATEFKSLLKQANALDYRVTDEDCVRWFQHINSQLFDNELQLVPFEFKWLRSCWAYYQYFPRTPGKPMKIVMHKRYPTEKVFIECLAHEMVHHWQYIKLGWKNVDHADEFVAWSTKARKLGLRISEEQPE